MATDDDAKLLDSKVKLFDALLRIWAHADAYLWNRARLILGVQAGVLAGASAVNEIPFIAAIILFAGALLSAALFLMVKRDEQTRNWYFQYIDPLADDIFAPPLYTSKRSSRLIPPTASHAPFRAGRLIDMAFISLVVVDIVLAGVFLCIAYSPK